jgi:hypothetical protein
MTAGRPRWQPSDKERKKALRLARLTFSTRHIALALRVDVKTLKNNELYYEIADARLALKTKLLRSLLAEARQGYSRAEAAILKRLDRLDDTGTDAGAPPELPKIEEIEAKNEGNGR